ncbi:hypothetical protein GCM10023340_01790 [Nocardioides marinquilinus]|uniref:Uncharacterized protein n=1 Tax=Nocardioides marinquilinus TaxID=1210400 RepID=A0ABP9P6U8_9ACTN
MPDHDDDLERLLGERVRAATATVRPRADAPAVVRAEVGRRHRRRRLAAGAAAAAVAVAVAVPVTVVALRADDRDGTAPSDRASDPPPVDARRPAAFFAEVLGGRAYPVDVSYRATPRQRVHLSLRWWPDGADAPPRIGGVAVERYRGDATSACEALGGSCRGLDDGGVGRVDETAAGDAVLDPVARVAPVADVRGADPDAPVLAATVLRPDGWAVTLTVCGCTPGGERVDPGVTTDALLAAAADDGWVPRPGAPSD